MSDAATSIADARRYPLLRMTNFDAELTAAFAPRVHDRALAVLRQIQEDLEQALAVRPDQRRGGIDRDRQPDVFLFEGWLYDDAEFLE
jgi:hypothetical protein